MWCLLRRSTLVSVLVFFAFTLACTKTHTVREPPEGAPTAFEPYTGPPIAAAPQTILEKSGVKKLQMTLQKIGFEVQDTGELDAATRKALRRYQREQGLAATGLPDLATLRMLRMDAREIYADL